MRRYFDDQATFLRANLRSAMVLATALGPGITGGLIDLGVPLPTQMLWMGAWCLIASLGLMVASRMVTVRENGSS